MDIMQEFLEKSFPQNRWRSLFNGRDLTGWQANVMPESFRVEGGAIVTRAPKPSSHLFFVGESGGEFVRFKNFELEIEARSEPNANSGVFFHTDRAVRNAQNHLTNGYEVQLNSSAVEKRKTGSLYAVVDLDKSPVDESRWFKTRIKVVENRIEVFVDGKRVIDYIQPPNPTRPTERAGRLLRPEGGAIALQAHDPNSVFYFRSLRLKRLA